MINEFRRWIMLCEASEAAHDGDAYFDLGDTREAHAHKSRTTLIYMSPAEFLAMAEPGHDMTKQANISAILRQGIKFKSIPTLQFIHDGKGTAKVISHEGRHRARALKARGIKEMPVLFLSSETMKGKGIRWGSQDNEIDKVSMMPTRLISQNGRSTMPFPKSVIF